jgi:hypothetical protein
LSHAAFLANDSDIASFHLLSINLCNDFFSIPLNHLNQLATVVLAFVLPSNSQPIAHTIKFPILPSTVFQSNGQVASHNVPQAAPLVNIDIISLAWSALSFLEIASANHLDMAVSLLSIFISHNHSFAAASSICFLKSDLMFLNHFALSHAVSHPAWLYIL